MDEEDDRMQNLRSKATELLLRKEWKASIEVYSELISLYHDQISNPLKNLHPNNLPKLKKSLFFKIFLKQLKIVMKHPKIGNTHFKTSLIKGKVLLSLNKYGMTLDYFKEANLDIHELENCEMLNGYSEKCKKFEFLSRTGAFDITDWILAEYIGSIEIKKSEISGRGLFATKNLDCGIPESLFRDSKEQAQLDMGKSFIDEVMESIKKCIRTRDLIRKLSNGENENNLEAPDIDLFRPEAEDSRFHDEKIDKEKLLNNLDVNSIVEELISAKILGKHNDVHGIGLWILASFINHSCDPNVRRSHVGDHVMIHASRDIKAGEELTFAYFDVFSPFRDLKRRRKIGALFANAKESIFLTGKGLDNGGVVYRLEESMRRWMVRGKGKGYMRLSFWQVYSEVYESERLLRKWGSKIPVMDNVLDSVVDAVGSDERIVTLLMRGLKRKNGHKVNGISEMEKAMKLGSGLYGKIMKKQTLKTILIQLGN
ncbi:unnamed protein product [Withania somnifera]